MDSNADAEVALFDVSEFWSEKFDRNTYESFDQWGRLLAREQENEWISTIISSRSTKEKIHIRNISTSESVEFLRDLYEELGYFTDYPRKCVIPFAVAPVTASVNIRNVLLSSKDKNFVPDEVSYPPLRSPSDQRMIITGLRTGVISGIEMDLGDESLLDELLTKEILSPFEIGRLCAYNFEEIGLAGEMHRVVLTNEE